MIYSFSSFSFISMIYSYPFLKFILDATSWVTFLRVSNFIYILYVIYILMRQCAAFHIIWYLFRLIVTHGVPLVEQELLFSFRSTWFHSVFFCFLSAVLSAILCLFVLFFVCSSSSYGIFVYLFIVMMKTHLDLLQTQLNLYKHVVSPIPASDEAY